MATTTKRNKRPYQKQAMLKTWARAQKLAQHYNLTNNEARHLISQLPQQDKQNLHKLLDNNSTNTQDLNPIIQNHIQNHTSHGQNATQAKTKKLLSSQENKITLDQAEELLKSLNPLLQKYGLHQIQKTINVLQQIQSL